MGGGTSDALARMEAELGALRERAARQERELSRLRGSGGDGEAPDGGAERTSRRRMLARIGLAAGAVAVSVAAGKGETSVEAADGGALLLGRDNTAESQTNLTFDGTTSPSQVLKVTSAPFTLTLVPAAVAGGGVTTGNPAGFYGFSNQAGPQAFGVAGRHGAAGTGVYGTASGAGTGVGGNVTGTGVGSTATTAARGSACRASPSAATASPASPPPPTATRG